MRTFHDQLHRSVHLNLKLLPCRAQFEEINNSEPLLVICYRLHNTTAIVLPSHYCSCMQFHTFEYVDPNDLMVVTIIICFKGNDRWVFKFQKSINTIANLYHLDVVTRQ